jgi:hypothetical protein
MKAPPSFYNDISYIGIENSYQLHAFVERQKKPSGKHSRRHTDLYASPPATRLSWPTFFRGFRPVVLRHRLSAGLPFPMAEIDSTVKVMK